VSPVRYDLDFYISTFFIVTPKKSLNINIIDLCNRNERQIFSLSQAHTHTHTHMCIYIYTGTETDIEAQKRKALTAKIVQV
jgi:hypothetical protein